MPEWPQILARANELPPNKRWRFASDARERINRDGRDFLDRQLHETSWLAKLAKQYVGAICNPNEVWVVTGQHTGLIRDKWGLNTLLPDHNYTNAKNRADHRHHALDACVIATTDRSLLQRITRDYNRDRHKIVVETPWVNFRTDLQNALASITVSHRRDHEVQGKLHDETAYGFVKNPPRPDEDNLVYRKPLLKLTSNEIDSIRDERLRSLVRSFVDEKIALGVKHEDALKSFNADVKDPQFKHGLQRVRIFKSKNPKYLLQLREPTKNAPYKAYASDSNLYMEIFEKSDGSWSGEAITVHQANQGKVIARWPSEHLGARLLMRVYKDDLVRIDYDGSPTIARVVRLEPSQKRIRLASHNEAGSLEERHKNPNDPYRWIFGQYDRLKDWNAVPVRVDELGRVWRITPG